MGKLVNEYTPTTEEIRERWMNFDGGPDATDAAEFDRWFASEIAKAEQRGVDRLEEELVRQDCFSGRTLRIADSLRAKRPGKEER